MKYLFQRLLTALFTMFLVSVFCFLAFAVIRGDPAGYLLGIDASPEEAAALREEMGLNRSVIIRYFEWLSAFLSGNPGNAYTFHRESISFLIADKLPVSVTLALLSLFLIVLISLPVSLLTVKREGNAVDKIVNFLTAAGLSAPGFFLGLLFIFIFGFTFKIFVPGNFIDYEESFSGFLGCLFFPALAIAIPNSAVLIKFLRGSLFKELKSEYVRTAASKGASRFYILRRHVLKNAIIPSITVFAMIIAEVFSGSIVIEQVFTIPGIGRLLIAAISSRDYPVIQALMVYIAFLVVAANTLADIAIMLLDPRIKPSKDIQ